jgi:hypothetical protein
MHASKEELLRVLMALGRSSWLAGATGSRLPVVAHRPVDAKVNPRAPVFSEETPVAVHLHLQLLVELLPRRIAQDPKSAWWVQGPGDSFHQVGWVG